MNIIFICQVVDENHPIQATTVQWIRVLAKQSIIERVDVLALRIGRFSLPDNVFVHVIGRENRLATVIAFYRHAFTLGLKKNTVFFVYQNGPYPLLLLPIRLLLGKKVFQWLAHPHNSWMTRLNAHFGTTKIFTSTASAFPLQISHRIALGQGVNLERFYPRPGNINYDLITVGRITPVKNLSLIIKSLAWCRDNYGVYYRLAIVGDTATERDLNYKKEIEQLIIDKQLMEQVIFLGSQPQAELPIILTTAKAFIFCCGGALGRAVVEAMACGLPVVTTNICVKEILPENLQSMLYCQQTAPDIFGEVIYQLLAKNVNSLANIRQEMIRIAREEHSDKGLFSKIMKEISNE